MLHSAFVRSRSCPMIRLMFALLVAAANSQYLNAQSFTWNMTGNGTWNDNASWNPSSGFPNSATQSAIFGNSLTSSASVNLTAGVTVNTLAFDGITGLNAYSIGLNGVTFGGAG